jgi:Rad3-related DNA helicase
MEDNEIMLGAVDEGMLDYGALHPGIEPNGAEPVKNLNRVTSTDIRDHFPFPSIRPSQELALQAIERAYAENKKFIIIEAPTGIGKSGIAVAAASHAKTMFVSNRFEPGAYILSPQKTLTAQYMKDFESMGLLELKGRSNYICAPFCNRIDDMGDVDCETASLMWEEEHDGPGSCCTGYKPAKRAFCASPLGVTNFSYFLLETNKAGQLVPRNMLVLDEGHNTEDEILKLASIEITKYRAAEIDIPFSSVPYIKPGQNEKAREWLNSTFVPAAQSALDRLSQEIDEAKGEQKARLAKRRSGLERFLDQLGLFLAAENLADWMVFSESEITKCPNCHANRHAHASKCHKCETEIPLTPARMVVKPLTATLFANQYLFSKADKILIMSATILNFDTFMRNLGISPKNAVCLQLQSEFPAEKRLTYVMPVANMGHKTINDALPMVSSAVAKIMGRNTSKGIVHTHSYRINSYLTNHLPYEVTVTNNRTGETVTNPVSGRIVTHTAGIVGDRDRAVARHFESDEPTVLFSPSMTEGLDLKDDLARFSVITKVPYPYLDPYVRARMDRDPKWYAWKTALALVQATGRCNRHKEDNARHYILDEGFIVFVTKNEDMFPRWWLDALIFISKDRTQEFING